MIKKFIQKAIKILPDEILNGSGSVIYSSKETLRPGKYYILGFNPGGNAEDNKSTVLNSLNDFSARKKNAYLDERWKSNSGEYEIGEHPLQRHLVEVMKTIGQDLRDVCASNLIFLRSPGHYGVKYPASAKDCWGIHEMILEIVQPRIILAFGNGPRSPYNFLLHKYNAYESTSIDCKPGSKWKCRFFKTKIQDREASVIGLPHLSRYSIKNKDMVVKWIKGLTT
ncbi:hypothetical protein QQ020_23750 [Fulvivirgaceae bacterium BMA12]|uniref:Uracil-DNA glycosylase-like domain-containing protein n=1 Tax=Agaribacillus aureus TaxID=3051825 RepID=A0ABT8LD25_9BACT|nr:hypothetical protein [Fulvivirgaceae bacterium BMA12]